MCYYVTQEKHRAVRRNAMIGIVQNFVRGFIVDPELEEKARKLADEAGAVMKDARISLKNANVTMAEAKRALRRHGNVQSLVAFSGIGLFVAGLMLGAKYESLTPQQKEEVLKGVRDLRASVRAKREEMKKAG